MDSSKNNNNEKEASSEYFKYVDGRRYHNVPNLRYILPNDDEEFDRLQMQHEISKYVWQSNFSSPVHEILKNGGKDVRVLDVGCGPGKWTLEVSSDYPQTEFYGIDVVPIFPSSIKQTNVKFSIQNATKGLQFPDNYFDFVYIRCLTTALSTEEWNIVINEIARVTKGDGYVEIMEWESKIYNQGPIAKKLMDSLIADLRSRNLNDRIIDIIPEIMEKTNQLTDIVHDTRNHPQGRYGDKLGKIALDTGLNAFRAFKPKFSKEYNMTSEEYDKLLEEFVEEMDIYKPHNATHRYWGKKSF